MHTYVVVIPAYNEEHTITNCIESIFSAAVYCRNFELEAILICINGCTDNTEYILENLKRKYKKIILLKEQSKGYVSALNKSIDYAKNFYPRSWIIKIDADSKAEERSFSILLDQLKSEKRLFLVGGHPIPDFSSNSYESGVLSRILAIRALFPMSEISKKDVIKYHIPVNKYSDKIDPAWEQNSKIYFHGRFWAAKRAAFLQIPPSQIGDDIYLAAYIYTRFGLNTIRVRYDANCLFLPIYSLKHHWKTYRRIYEDLNCVRRNEKLSWYADESQTKLNWPYIIKLKPVFVLMFLIYTLIVSLERISFRLIPYNENTWQYKTKVYEKTIS